MELTKEKEEQLQQDIMTHLDSCPEDLINELCQVVVDYKNINENNNNKSNKSPIKISIHWRIK